MIKNTPNLGLLNDTNFSSSHNFVTSVLAVVLENVTRQYYRNREGKTKMLQLFNAQ